MDKLIVLFLFLVSFQLPAQQKAASFRIVPLGTKGGIDESNLSAYMAAPVGSHAYICLDAGTVRAGIEKAVALKTFSIGAAQVQKKYISGYLISHAHLDHVAGLVITSPDDTAKTVYALPACMKMLEDYYFNGEAWANFGDEGKGFLIKQYHFKSLTAGEEIPIEHTSMQVTAFPLSHVNPFESTAFLINHQGAYILYLGDTGSDSTEKSNRLQQLWEAVAPLVKEHRLKGIFIEVSFPNDQSDKQLFGHLTPKWLMTEMEALGELTGRATLRGLNIVVTHVKPPYSRVQKLTRELKEGNKLGLHLIFPQQGRAFEL